jgi:hypothetical protein
LALFSGNHFEILLRLASDDLQQLSADAKALVLDVVSGLSDQTRKALGDELILRARRAALAKAPASAQAK